jgi:hypothetical protein
MPWWGKLLVYQPQNSSVKGALSQFSEIPHVETAALGERSSTASSLDAIKPNSF